MLKSTLLFLSEREGLKNLLFRLPFSRNAATRFVAGDVSTDALAVACELNGRGFRVTLDLLGEAVDLFDETGGPIDEPAETAEPDDEPKLGSSN